MKKLFLNCFEVGKRNKILGIPDKGYHHVSKPKINELIKEADEISKIIASIIINAK
ncbi:MAG: hypothetical protein AAB212_00470 [Bacteroidota bacterium]